MVPGPVYLVAFGLWTLSNQRNNRTMLTSKMYSPWERRTSKEPWSGKPQHVLALNGRSDSTLPGGRRQERARFQQAPGFATSGFGPDRVPDFLGLLDAPDAELAGQDELVPDALSRELDRRRDTVTELAHRFGLGVPATTKIIEQRIRLGQHRFATAVVRAFDHTCAFCGYRPASVLGHRLLVASHIKPWADCCDLERLDTRNGVAACPVHDAAFDTGLPAVDDGLTIWLSRALAASLARDDGAAAYFGRGVLRASLVLPSGVAPPAPEYLRNHREQVFADRPS